MRYDVPYIIVKSDQGHGLIDGQYGFIRLVTAVQVFVLRAQGNVMRQGVAMPAEADQQTDIVIGFLHHLKRLRRILENRFDAPGGFS